MVSFRVHASPIKNPFLDIRLWKERADAEGINLRHYFTTMWNYLRSPEGQRIVDFVAEMQGEANSAPTALSPENGHRDVFRGAVSHPSRKVRPHRIRGEGPVPFPSPFRQPGPPVPGWNVR